MEHTSNKPWRQLFIDVRLPVRGVYRYLTASIGACALYSITSLPPWSSCLLVSANTVLGIALATARCQASALALLALQGTLLLAASFAESPSKLVIFDIAEDLLCCSATWPQEWWLMLLSQSTKQRRQCIAVPCVSHDQGPWLGDLLLNLEYEYFVLLVGAST